MDNNRNIPPRNNQGGPNNQKKNKIISVFVTFIVALIFTSLMSYMFDSATKKEITYNQFIDLLDQGQVEKVTFDANKIYIVPKTDGTTLIRTTFWTTKLDDPDLITDLKDKYDNDPHLLQKVTVEDIRSFGMIPEFIGRLPIIFTLDGLNEDMLVKILQEPKNAILKQYQKLLALDEVKLEFEDGALHAIAAKALERDTGARALRAILEEYMLDIMYEIPKDDSIGEVVITREYIEGNGGPKILLRGQEPILLEGSH